MQPGAAGAAEQLAHQLDCVAAGDTIADHERGNGCLQARTEGAARHRGRKLGTRLAPALAATHPVQTVLGHPHGDRRQLGDLVALRGGDVDSFRLAEAMTAAGAAALRADPGRAAAKSYARCD